MSERAAGALRDQAADIAAALPPRLASIGVWLQRVAHQPVALWWAAQQVNLHPSIKKHIDFALRQDPNRFPEPTRRGWRMLFAAWDDVRDDPDMRRHDIEARTRLEGWAPSLVREFAGLYRPRLKVNKSFDIRHPLHWEGMVPDKVVRIEVDYPHPHEALPIPDNYLRYAVTHFRENLELAIALKLEATGAGRLHFETSRANDDGPELPGDSYGLTGPIIFFQKLVAQLATIDTAAAHAEAAHWPTDDEHVFARLRIWAAGTKLLSPEKAAEVFLSLPDVVFWGSLHQRDLLYALRDRWPELSVDARAALENRLRTGSYPWNEEVLGGPKRLAALDRLSRLHWLTKARVAFSFDVGAEMDALRPLAPDWTERAGDEAAKSNAPVVYDVETDTSPNSILETPIAEILTQAREAGRLGFRDRVQREPFSGLAERRPARALAALTHVGRMGEAPRCAWSAFLYADSRPSNSLRLIRAIAARTRATSSRVAQGDCPSGVGVDGAYRRPVLR